MNADAQTPTKDIADAIEMQKVNISLIEYWKSEQILYLRVG